MASLTLASPEIETLLPLTTDEQRRLKECEKVIQRGLATFYEVGNALAEIRESRLYRLHYATFEDYCVDRWGMSRPRAYQLIGAASVLNNLSTIVDKPSTESQARELVSFEPEVQKAVWQIAVKTAPTDNHGDPLITAAHIKSVADVLTEVVQSGGLDDGSGEIKPIGVLVDHAVTEETYERIMRQKAHIKERLEAQESNEAKERKPRQRPERTEVEALHDPEIQKRLGDYIDMITQFENMEWPPELAYLLRMFQLHKSHAYFQKSRNVEDDCEMALNILERLTPDPQLSFEIAAQEHYDWLFDLGYCMSKQEYTARLKRMSEDGVRMALLTDAGDDGKQEDRRGVLPGIVCIPWRKVWDYTEHKKRAAKEDEDEE